MEKECLFVICTSGMNAEQKIRSGGLLYERVFGRVSGDFFEKAGPAL